MSQQKKRNPRFVTETGIAIYPHLIAADTKYDSDGEFKTKLRLSPDDILKDAKGKSVGNFQEFLDEKMDKALELAKKENPKVKRIKQADAPYEIDDETGELVVNFKLKQKGKTKDGKEFTQKPALFDAKGRPTEPESLWGGSKIKISFEVIPFYTKLIGAGITLRLKAVQIIELSQGNGGDADSYGFGSESDDEDEDYDNDFGSEEVDDDEEEEGFDSDEEDEEEDGDF